MSPRAVMDSLLNWLVSSVQKPSSLAEMGWRSARKTVMEARRAPDLVDISLTASVRFCRDWKPAGISQLNGVFMLQVVFWARGANSLSSPAVSLAISAGPLSSPNLIILWATDVMSLTMSSTPAVRQLMKMVIWSVCSDAKLHRELAKLEKEEMLVVFVVVVLLLVLVILVVVELVFVLVVVVVMVLVG